MLSTTPTIAFIATRDADGARAFYQDVLGLHFVTDDGFALIFEAGGRPLRIARVPDFTPHAFTIFGWEPDDLEATVDVLASRGVEFLRFDGLAQDSRGIWSPADGAQVAWFRDPDGNLLSLSGHS